jgi:hypothetical protein
MVHKLSFVCAAVVALSGAIKVQAATITISASAPTVDGADIAETTGTLVDNNDYIWFNQPNRGQTFTTLSNASGYDLSAFSFYNIAPFTGALLSAINVRVRNSSNAILLDETGSAPRTPNRWVTATLATPVHLNPLTTYGIEFQSFTVDPQGPPLNDPTLTWDGFPFANLGEVYAGGTGYSGTTNVDPAVINKEYDYAFHANLTASFAVPEPSTFVLATLGLVGLGCVALRRK